MIISRPNPFLNPRSVRGSQVCSGVELMKHVGVYRIPVILIYFEILIAPSDIPVVVASVSTYHPSIYPSTMHPQLVRFLHFLGAYTQVFSDVELTEDVGAYRLTVNFSSSEMSTKCLHWDSTALEVETALESLNNVDSVEVERVGSGGEADR